MGVTIIREMVGSSPASWSEAAQNAVTTASLTVRDIREVEVVRHTAKVDGSSIVEYQVQLKVHFEYDGS